MASHAASSHPAAPYRRILILGGGCIGLTTAISVLEAKLADNVLLVADRFSPMTTTNQSGAVRTGGTPLDSLHFPVVFHVPLNH